MNGWLSLGRRAEQRIVIEVPPSATPTLIEVKPTLLQRDRCRLAFRAPPHVRIDRGEVRAEKETDARAAAGIVANTQPTRQPTRA